MIGFRKSEYTMKNWVKRLFGLVNNEMDNSNYETTSHNFVNDHKEHRYNGQHSDAKVVYEYPKGNFRFPVIPDEESFPIRETKSAAQHPVQKTRQRAPEIQTTRKENFTRKDYRNQRRNKITPSPNPKRPFQPTEVPSPVYGFSKPPLNRRNEILEMEKEVAISIEDSLYEAIESDRQIDHIDQINQFDNQIEIQIDDQAETVEQESINLNKNDLENPPSVAIVENQDFNNIPTSNEEIKFKKTITPIPSMAVKRQEQAVPFNVLMFKQDKQNSIPQQPREATNGLAVSKPSLNLLNVPKIEVDNDQEWLQEQSQLLDSAFESFNVGAKVVRATKGPAVTQFEVQPEHGVRVNKITNLSDDLKLALAARDIRIEAPIPGKSTVGIEVPNRKSRPVLIREILHSSVFQKSTSPLIVALGLDISGQPIVTDLNKMPHGLIAGATGSGKSVCINSIIISLLYKAAPHEVKLLLIDPKMVELAPYNDLPHLVSPVINDVKAATAALKWAVDEMERRYEVFAHEGVRDITRYNEKVLRENPKAEIMPYLVIIIDELADLMMVSPADVEEAICRIAQKARACGIHLILATQRPSVDVITGLIKANIPTRIAFSVSSQVDSRTIIDISGAEKLLGRGDMLFLENGSNKPVRIQGNFVSDDEIERVTQFVRDQMEPDYLFVQDELIKNATEISGDDELFIEACEFVVDQEGASASSLQRRFRIGYNRAARLIDIMEAQGIISETKGSKPRDVLLTKEQLLNLKHDGV